MDFVLFMGGVVFMAGDAKFNQLKCELHVALGHKQKATIALDEARNQFKLMKNHSRIIDISGECDKISDKIKRLKIEIPIKLRDSSHIYKFIFMILMNEYHRKINLLIDERRGLINGLIKARELYEKIFCEYRDAIYDYDKALRSLDNYKDHKKYCQEIAQKNKIEVNA